MMHARDASERLCGSSGWTFVTAQALWPVTIRASRVSVVARAFRSLFA
jgi:hypothetical protein